MRPKISIALCTYNGAKYLTSQLESYLSQTQLPDELVVCDDCSLDDTVTILEGFAERAPFSVRIWANNPNIGSTKNFEKAISLCSGDIIFLSDQDDIWMTNKIEKVTNEFDRDDKVGMVFSDVELVDGASESLGGSLFESGIKAEERILIEKGELFSILLGRDIVIGAALTFRSKFTNAILPIPTDIPNMIHDGWIAMIISAVAKYNFLDEPLIKYRQHDEQQTGVANYVPGLFNMAWNDALERGERKHKAMKDHIELLKSYIISRIDPPDQIIDALNAEIQYQKEYALHYQSRREVLNCHVERPWLVIKELLSGRYHRFSNGIRSAARDLFVDPSQETEFYELIDKRKAV